MIKKGKQIGVVADQHSCGTGSSSGGAEEEVVLRAGNSAEEHNVILRFREEAGVGAFNPM